MRKNLTKTQIEKILQNMEYMYDFDLEYYKELGKKIPTYTIKKDIRGHKKVAVFKFDGIIFEVYRGNKGIRVTNIQGKIRMVEYTKNDILIVDRKHTRLYQYIERHSNKEPIMFDIETNQRMHFR